MKRMTTAAAFACALSLLAAGAAGAHRAAASAAMPPISFGVADDASKYADDGGVSFYGQLRGASLAQNRWTLAWDASNPTAITELPFLQRAAPAARAAGVHVVLALYSKHASEHDPAAFCAWAGIVARTAAYWGINDLIVWNEPNTRLYWVPQKDAAGNDVAGPAYETLLATCYDSIKAANPSARVIGMGLSPRASTSDSNEPLTFLRDVGRAYRASGRTKPIMDQLALHPYPPTTTAGPDTGYSDPNRFGIPDMGRVKQAVWDSFNGTAQPTTLNGLTFRIDEAGWQVDTTGKPGYVNDENVATISEQQQAEYLSRMVGTYFACDPAVTDVLLFLLADEKYRNGRDASGTVVGGGWQSGLVLADGVTHRQAYDTIASLAAKGRAACAGAPVAWQPSASGGQTDKPKPKTKQKPRRPKRK